MGEDRARHRRFIPLTDTSLYPHRCAYPSHIRNPRRGPRIFLGILRLNPVLNNPTTVHKPDRRQNYRRFTKVPGPAGLRHLRVTSEKHQKFATLSLNNPREGKRLVM